MHYLGNDKYEIFIGGRFIELTKLEIITFIEDTQYLLEELGYVNINHSSLDEILDELEETYEDKKEFFDDLFHFIGTIDKFEMLERGYIDFLICPRELKDKAWEDYRIIDLSEIEEAYQYEDRDRFLDVLFSLFCEINESKVLENKGEYSKELNNRPTTKQEECNKKQPRGYTPNPKIKQLFAKYYDDTKTKREVFTKISKELKISFKAVEKAFYLK